MQRRKRISIATQPCAYIYKQVARTTYAGDGAPAALGDEVDDDMAAAKRFEKWRRRDAVDKRADEHELLLAIDDDENSTINDQLRRINCVE